MTAIDDGYFYQTIDLPRHGTIVGAWDLRQQIDAYLGFTELAGKRVLEVGAANGYVTFHMEGQGASVVAYDLSPDRLGDIMRYPGLDVAAFEGEYRGVVAGLNKAWWFAHSALGSRAILVHGTAYDVSQEIGPVDVSTFGCILLHLRDPYSALEQAARLTRERIVVTDTLNPPFSRSSSEAAMVFNPTLNNDPCTWWSLTPGAVQRMLAPLGFSRSRVFFHQQIFHPGFRPWGHTRPDQYRGAEAVGALFTVVADRG